MVYWQPDPRNSCKLRINIPTYNSIVKITRLLLYGETSYVNAKKKEVLLIVAIVVPWVMGALFNLYIQFYVRSS